MRCKLAGVTIHYRSRGSGRPLLMLHGTPLDSGASEYELESALSRRRGWRRLYPDLPGHGKTPGPESIRDMDDYLQVVLEFVDKVVGGKRFVLGGTSFGAYVALGIVHERPRAIDGLLLAVPAITMNTRRTRPRRVPVTLQRDPAILAAAHREGMDWLKGLVVAQNAPLLAYARVLNSTVTDVPFADRVSAKDFSFEPTDLAQPFPAPTLFLFGRQDHPYRYRQLWKSMGKFPRATFAVLDQAGHLLWGEQKELCRALVDEWMDRVETWTRAGRRSGQSSSRR